MLRLSGKFCTPFFKSWHEEFVFSRPFSIKQCHSEEHCSFRTRHDTSSLILIPRESDVFPGGPASVLLVSWTRVVPHRGVFLRESDAVGRHAVGGVVEALRAGTSAVKEAHRRRHRGPARPRRRRRRQVRVRRQEVHLSAALPTPELAHLLPPLAHQHFVL